MIKCAASLEGGGLVAVRPDMAAAGVVECLSLIVPVTKFETTAWAAAVVIFGAGADPPWVMSLRCRGVPVVREAGYGGDGPFFSWTWTASRGMAQFPVAILEGPPLKQAHLLLEMIERIKISPAERFLIDLRWD